jgi:hypothetical protein
LVDPGGKQKLKILDIAAGHGLYGIAFAKEEPAEPGNRPHLIGQMYWKCAKENARKAGVLGSLFHDRWERV